MLLSAQSRHILVKKMEKEILIPEMNIPALKEEFEKMVKKAERLNITPPKLRISRTHEMKKFKYHMRLPDGQVFTSSVPMKYVKCFYEGNIPVINGWKPICNLKHNIGATNLIGQFYENQHLNEKEVEKLNSLTSSLATCKPNCDHCKTKRSRSETFVLMRGDETIQVGSTCVNDFLGDGVLDHFMYSLDASSKLLSFSDVDDDYFFPSERGNGKSLVETKLLLSVAALITDKHGYTSSRKAVYPEDATFRKVIDSIIRPYGDVLEIFRQYGSGENKYVNAAEQLLDWANSKEIGNNSFVADMKAVASSSYIALSERLAIAVLSAIPSSFKREKEMEEKIERLKSGNDLSNSFFGTEKERGSIKLKVSGVEFVMNNFGRTQKISFRDDDGRSFIWESTSSSKELSVGDNVILTATIKKHYTKLSTGKNTTILTRCADITPCDADAAVPEFKKEKKAKKQKNIDNDLGM